MRGSSRLCTNILSFSALDVSADLTELSRTPVAVISAGVKSILDIGRTLEYLVSYKIIESQHTHWLNVSKRQALVC